MVKKSQNPLEVKTKSLILSLSENKVAPVVDARGYHLHLLG